MLTILAFIVALAILIAVHEFGHYRMARACGVKVLRFSIGFGPSWLRWQSPRSGTEFVVCALPLGGYVRMLDEHEGAVAPHERHLAFNAQPLRSRALIVAAGPAANLLLAVLLYALVNWLGVEQAAPVLGTPVPQSLAAQAGLQGGERVVSVVDTQGQVQAVASFDDVRWQLTQAALEGRDLSLVWLEPGRERERRTDLPLSTLKASEPDEQMHRRIGLLSPYSSPVLGKLVEQGAAQRAGLMTGDRVLRFNERAVQDSRQLREDIRASVKDGQAQAAVWELVRDGQTLSVRVEPDLVREGEQTIARVGAMIGSPVEMTTVRYGLVEGLTMGLARTWEMSVLSLRMMARVLTGQASVKNISGPLTIADYAGRSASVGLMAYLTFMALISVSLGVLNLLPVPVLDGGHLMYYLWEALTGRPVSAVWLERFGRLGLALLALMMGVAVFNDLTRLLG